MDLFDVLWILAAFCLCGPTGGQAEWDEEGYNTDASQTFNLVFHKYNPKVRPPQPYVAVTLDVALHHIRMLDIRAQELQTVMDVEMKWYDSRLKWDADRINRINVNASDVWSPDIIVTNAVVPVRHLYPDTVRISSDGNVASVTKVLVTTRCMTSLTETTHSCNISVGFLSNIRAAGESDRFFTNESKFVFPENFRNHDWDLLSADFKTNEDNTTMATLCEVQLTLKKRKPPTSTMDIRNATKRLTATETNSSPVSVNSLPLLLTSVFLAAILQCLNGKAQSHR